MTKLEFRNFLNSYKQFSEECKSIFKKEFPDEKFCTLYIKEGRIKVAALFEKEFDITNLVISSLIPDDLIF